MIFHSSKIYFNTKVYLNIIFLKQYFFLYLKNKLYSSLIFFIVLFCQYYINCYEFFLFYYPVHIKTEF